MIIRISEVLLVAVRFNYVLLNGFLFIFFFTTMSLTNFVINFSFKFSAGGGFWRGHRRSSAVLSKGQRNEAFLVR